ncbi:MAG: helix-turn-helix transcriptional regulator [Treponema sp.]|nr:helix-turn-helix transcriptional regulator [Treponema sp.]
MIFSEKLVVLRKNKGMTQDALAEKLNVSRQAVAKWESGQTYPDISNLIQISDLMNVTVDYLVRDGECMMNVTPGKDADLNELIEFRLEANVNTYAAFMNEVQSTRLDSHDFRYQNGDYVYHDTYVGGEQFAGEEAVWKSGKSVYAMNYLGRVLSKEFSGNFLKDALRHADKKMPYRGPEHYEDGEYIYKCSVNGNFEWFQGYEEIFWREKKVYECYFHGGLTR